MASAQWTLCVTVRNCCFCIFYMCGSAGAYCICALASVCTDLFSIRLSLSVLQVFWGHCINALIHSIILFWFPLKLLEHGE